MFDKDFYTPTEKLHKDIGVLLVKDIYKLYLAKFVYKHQHGLLPDIFNNYFTTNDYVHKYNTRQNMNLHKSQNKTMYGSKTTKQRGIQFWNEVPLSLRKVQGVKSFARQVKDYIIQKY